MWPGGFVRECAFFRWGPGASRTADDCSDSHRGPDDSGVWANQEAGIALGFRRLSIIDLSELGHQPMRSASGRFILVFNGEVFNHNELRRELEAAGDRFRGHSDTEVILAAFDRWGIDAAVRRFVGMFAIAVWDGVGRELTLIRDRLGIKPLYIYWQRGLLTFGSELKALLAGPEFDRNLDPVAVTAYLRHLYVPAPRSVYLRTLKLLPGHLLTVSDVDVPLPASRAYWSVEDAARQGLAEQFSGTDEEAIDAFDNLFTEAVRLRLEADVPLGALLSGGIDSSAVVATMQSLVTRPVKTFTIGFDQAEHDESAYARRIAAHLGTDHTELRVTADDALAVVPRLPEIFDEPLADPSQIPTYLVSALARRSVTVALTGDGGDELLAGYNRYLYGETLIRRAGHWPRSLRRLTAFGLGSLAPESWNRVHEALSPFLPRQGQTRLAGTKLRKVGDLLSADTEASRYLSLMSAWQAPALLLTNGREEPSPAERILAGDLPGSLLDRMMLADQTTYLPDDLLAKVDRASMAVSLEVRVPLLDHRLVEFSWRLPRRHKLRGRSGKWLLRQALYRHVPAGLVEREKVGSPCRSLPGFEVVSGSGPTIYWRRQLYGRAASLTRRQSAPLGNASGGVRGRMR